MEEIINNKCKHYVLGECSQKHHDNCKGMMNCINDLENENEQLKEKFKQVTILLPKEIDDMEKLVWTLNFDTLVADLAKYKTALEEIKGTIKHFKTYFSEKELNKVKFSDITVIEEIISEVENER